jgi:16S rRNA processing protein RimM
MTRRNVFSENDQTSGSPLSGEPDFLAVGKLHRAHGLQGEIRISVWTDFPERLVPGACFYLGPEHQVIRVRSVRAHQNQMIIAFDGYENREQVNLLRNQVVYVRRSELPSLPDDEYYLHQLLGMHVVEADGERDLGRIVEILETGANDVYIVRADNGEEYLLPGSEEVVVDIDFDQSVMRVQLLPGLLPDK